MNIKKLEKHSRNTKKQAKDLLQSTKLFDVLKKYGNVHLIGSYPLDVMYGPDIDIVVETQNIRRINSCFNGNCRKRIVSEG